MPEASWTILELLHWTTSYFKGKGVAEPRTSAEVLLAHVLGQDRLFLYLNHDQPLEEAELASFRQCIKRRLAGEPLQYITGSKEFWSLSFRVSPAALIPRPETEVLVQAVVDFLRDRVAEAAKINIIDLGTGAGVIAVSLACEIAAAEIVATDLSLAALQLARENARDHQVEDRIRFLCADIFAGLRPAAAKFMVVAANPPYISQAEFAILPREIRVYEPRYALDGGPDGLAAISRIIKDAPALLEPEGGLFVEVGAGQAARVSELVEQDGRYKDWRFLKDYGGIDRVLVAEKN